jgi:carbamoyl-phosphate synthase large subunit
MKLALGIDTKPFTDYKVGTMFIRYSYDLIGDISQFEKINIFGEL